MKDRFYPYDRDLYGRSFLNCYQRESLVMLSERVRDLHLLLHGCLISTDDILEQIVRLGRPKYGFESGLLDERSLAAIGVASAVTPADDFAAARPRMLEAIRETGFAIIVVDVFYLPHCPEYRAEHIVHTIVLQDRDPGTGEWPVIDDNPASVLCEYRYPESVIAAAFDNNVLREVRTFALEEYDAREAARWTAAAFAELLREHDDGMDLLAQADGILECPWIARERAIGMLHDALSVYQGSRTCLQEYLRRAGGDPAAGQALQAAIDGTRDVQNQLLIGKVTGAVDADSVTSGCLKVRASEEELLDLLRKGRTDRWEPVRACS